MPAALLPDWLISRRHCKKDFQHALDDIRAKIRNAIEDMPPNEDIKSILSESSLNYFKCLKILDLLKQTEADSKNIFGFYSSQRMKDWQEIIKAYEKDNVFLAEVAQILIRNVAYEVPSLKKQIQKCQQVAEECGRNECEYIKQSNANHANFQQAAEKLGLQGINVRKELLCQLDELPTLLDQILLKISGIEAPVEFYSTYLNFILKRDVNCLHFLRYMLSNGNTTVFQYRTGKVPEKVNPRELRKSISLDYPESSNDDQIDFGDGIDFGDDSASTETRSTGNGDFVHVDKIDLETNGSRKDEINWDVQNVDIEVIDENNGEAIARGDDALSVLEFFETRNQLMNELYELEGFLSQRIFEMEAEQDIISANQFQGAPEKIQLTTVDSVRLMLSEVKSVIALLENPKTKTLFYMKDSPKYIDHVIEKLRQHKTLADKALQKAKAMELKREEVIGEQCKLEPQVPLLLQQTKELQKLIENDISKRYRNRPVNIMGGVQML